MAYAQKEWIDRVSEYPMRRQLTDEEGNVELVTLERADGEVSAEGDAFSAANMNDLEQRVADAISAIDTSLSGLFSYDSSTGKLIIDLDVL